MRILSPLTAQEGRGRLGEAWRVLSDDGIVAGVWQASTFSCIKTSKRRASPVRTALFRRHEPLQLLNPVLHDDDARRRNGTIDAAFFDHQEPLAVG